MEILSWAPHLVSLEIRKILTYRLAFWIRYVLGTLTELIVIYFLWGAIFQFSGSRMMEGFSFNGILYYFVFGILSSRMIQGNQHGNISQEVYEGSLTRYLLYPLSYLIYKYVEHVGQQLISVGQMLFGLALAAMIWKLPSEQSISLQSIALGTVTALAAGGVVFIITSTLEMVSFWQDTVWNLLVMFRFITGLLGGLLVPLAFFPAWGRSLARATPFPLIYSFPIRCFLGQVGPSEWLSSMLILLGWGVVCAGIAKWVWDRGTRNYAGAGI